jgi:hypothetical protein
VYYRLNFASEAAEIRLLHGARTAAIEFPQDKDRGTGAASAVNMN